MLLQPAQSGGYQILRILQNTLGDEDVAALKGQLTAYLRRGIRKIALSFTENAFPYSKLIALIMQCLRQAQDAGGTLAVVVPSESFLRAAESVNLPSVVRLCGSEDEL